MNYSPAVHLTSNPEDYHPAAIVRKLERNKLVHTNYNEHLVTQGARK